MTMSATGAARIHHSVLTVDPKQQQLNKRQLAHVSIPYCDRRRLTNVTKKKMTFMMPNAKLAFNIAHVLLTLNENGFLVDTPTEPKIPRLR